MSDLKKILRTIPGYDPWATAGDCYLNEAEAEKAIGFFFDHLKFIEGEYAGFPFMLQSWQQAIVGNLYGWKLSKKDSKAHIDNKIAMLEKMVVTISSKNAAKVVQDALDVMKDSVQSLIEKGIRHYRTSLVFVPRKNGKTPLGAGIVCYEGFCGNEPGAQIYSAAAEREQASIIHHHAGGMIEVNKDLEKRSRVYKSFKSIEFFGCNGVYKALSSDAKTKHGQNAQLILVDELHVQPNRELVDTLVTSTASRVQPLMIHITTAGDDKNSICREIYDYACSVRDGIIDDKTFLPVIYEIEEDDNWLDEEIWGKCNPNLGVSVSMNYLKGEAKKAIDNPAYENTFRRLHLNQWTEQDVRWLPMHKWDECCQPFDLSILKGVRGYGGLDMATILDLTAFVAVFPIEDLYYVLWKCWAPQENAIRREKKDRVPYTAWARDGQLKLTPGNVVDYDVVRRDIKEFGDLYNVKEIGFDPWNATQIATQLMGDGFDMVQMRQGYGTLSEPSKRLEALIIDEKLRHGNHVVANWCASNVARDMDAAGNIKPSKAKSGDKIDLIVALINALGRMIAAEEEERSVYEDRGLLIL